MVIPIYVYACADCGARTVSIIKRDVLWAPCNCGGLEKRGRTAAYAEHPFRRLKRRSTRHAVPR